MTHVPKTVLARLREQPLDSLGDHLDPNLLAAFAEHTLLEKERSAVMAHLSRCAACRQSLALAFPAGVEPRSGEGVVTDRPAGSWHLLPARLAWSRNWRWITPAALLACAVATASIYYRVWRAAQRAASPATLALASKASPPPPKETPKIAREVAAPPVVSGQRAAVRAVRPVKEKAQIRPLVRPEQELARRQATVQAKAGLVLGKEPALRLAGTQERPTRSALQAAGPLAAPSNQVTGATVVIPGPPPAGSRPLYELSADSVKAQAGKAPEAAPGTEAAGAGPVGSSASQAAPPAPAPSDASQTVAVSPAAPLKAVKVSPQGANQSAGQPVPPAALGRLGVARANPAPGVAMGALWSIESWRDPSGNVMGRVQRSLDAGKTWEEVPVSDGVDFRAVAAVGPDVWAGGSPGGSYAALFHSSDAGAHWAAVRVEEAGQELSGAIRRIDADAHRVVITTDGGQKWLTRDSGRHWKLEPE